MKSIFLTLFLSLFVLTSPAKAAECIFGNEINSLTEETTNDFSIKPLGEFVKIARAELESTVVRVMVYEVIEKNKGNVFHLNYTYEDEFDGGNSIGWIENLQTLEIVAKIQDSNFYECTLTK